MEDEALGGHLWEVPCSLGEVLDVHMCILCHDDLDQEIKGYLCSGQQRKELHHLKF